MSRRDLEQGNTRNWTSVEALKDATLRVPKTLYRNNSEKAHQFLGQDQSISGPESEQKSTLKRTKTTSNTKVFLLKCVLLPSWRGDLGSRP